MGDFLLADHGSICLLYPQTSAAREWVCAHLLGNHMTWGHAVVIEPRYVADIIAGIEDDGLTYSAGT